MYKDRKRIYAIYLLIDIFFISFIFYITYKFNRCLVPYTLSEIRAYYSVLVFWGIVIIFILHNSHLYITDRSLTILQEGWRVARCVLFSAILVALFIFTLKVDIFSRLILIQTVILLAISLSLWRALKRIYVRYLIRKGYFNYNILIVGAGKTGMMLAEEIRNNPYLGIRIVGFLDDRQSDKINGFKIFGSTENLEDVVKKYFIDEIYVTIPSERKLTSDIILKGIKLGRTVRVVAEHFDLPYRMVGLNYIGIMPLLGYFEKSLHGTEKLAKRFTDIVISIILLFLLLPLFIIIAFFIKLESKGPIFYISKRSGKKGEIFDFYKFRSMVDNADNYKESLRDKSEVDGPIFKIRNDPRITKVGRVLRRYSIDELPQLINVLMGKMSLVGPRPFPVEESKKIESKYIARLNIKPGITGLAQIKGRSDLSYYHWVRWDIWYLNNWSLGLDLRILLWTIPVVLKRKGAY